MIGKKMLEEHHNKIKQMWWYWPIRGLIAACFFSVFILFHAAAIRRGMEEYNAGKSGEKMLTEICDAVFEETKDNIHDILWIIKEVTK
jgi:hypothetical protein